MKNYFDVLGAHPSGFSNPPDCMPSTPQCSLSGGWNNDHSFFAFTASVEYHDTMVQNGDDAKQIWFTEFGYDSNRTTAAGLRVLDATSPRIPRPSTWCRPTRWRATPPYVGGDVLEPELPDVGAAD